MSEIVLPPYAQNLGIHVLRMEGAAPLLACDPDDRAYGRAGFWHGGALSGLLEMAALAAVRSVLGIEGSRMKPVNITVQFMRGASLQPTFALGRVERAGRRMVNVSAEAWQEDRNRLVASARMNVMLRAAD